MTVVQKWDHPEQTHLKGTDLDALRLDIWPSFFIAAASVGAFQLDWELVFSSRTPEGLPTARQWRNVQNGNQLGITWDYTGDHIDSITLAYNDGSWNPPSPSVCTPVYDADGLLESYTWS